MSPFERKMALLTVIGIGLAAITAALFYVQLREMTNQTQILASQSEGASAGALMDEMNTRKQLAIAQKQAKAAQDSVDAIRDQTRLDQRAWLGVTEVATPTELHEGTLFNPTISLVNSGKTPAFNVVQRAGYRIIKAGNVFDPAHEVSITHPFRQGVVQPNGKRMLSVSDLGAIGRQRADELNTGMYRLYLFGEITYDDAFRLHHRTRFSMRMELGKTLAFAPYGSYDYAD